MGGTEDVVATALEACEAHALLQVKQRPGFFCTGRCCSPPSPGAELLAAGAASGAAGSSTTACCASGAGSSGAGTETAAGLGSGSAGLSAFPRDELRAAAAALPLAAVLSSSAARSR